MAFAQNAKEFIIQKKFHLLGLTLALALAGGGWFGWQKYTHSQSPEYFLDQLNAAMAAKDLESLARLVDFRSLSEDMAKRILAQPMPSEYSTPKQTEIPLLAEELQTFFLENIKDPKDAPTEEIEENSLDPLEPLPVDFISQIINNKFTLETRMDNGAIASVKLHYPRFKLDLPFYFYLKEVPEWRVIRVANAENLLKKYITEDSTIEAGRKQVYKKQREQDRKRIEKQFMVEGCTAFIHQPRGQKVPLLMVRVEGYNKGPFTIRNMIFDTTINVENHDAELSFKQRINTAARLTVGTNLEDSYTLELETESREAKILLGAEKVTCSAKVFFMTLDNGAMLHLEEDENSITQPLPKK